MDTGNELTALEGNLWSMWANFGRGVDSFLFDTPDLMWFETPIAALPYNAVMRSRLTDNIESEIDARFEHFRAAEKPFLWLIHPTATPANLPELLESRGFVEVEVCPGMVAKLDVLDSAGPNPDGFEIREVLSNEDIHAMVDFVVWRWGAPKATGPYLESIREHHRLGQSGSPTRVWMAWKDGQPLAKAVTHEAAGVIGLYGVSTRPEARGAGLGRYICLRALQEADAGRAMLGVLHSSPMAVNLYRKMGFREIAPFRLFTAHDFHI